MSVIGKNVRKIRTVKKLSQAAFAELFNLARPSVGAYEEKRSEPKLETVIQIAKHFSISIDSLLTKELTINDLYNFNVHTKENAKSDVISKKANRESDYIQSVLVPGNKQIEYIVHISNRDFIAKLPRILVPKYHDKNIRAFELTTDDMHNNFHGLNVGDLVFGTKMKLTEKFIDNKLYVVITKENIFIRRVTNKKEHFALVPDNSNFTAMEIDKGDLIEAWEVTGYFSNKIEAPTLIYERIMHLENQFDAMNKRLLKMEKP